MVIIPVSEIDEIRAFLQGCGLPTGDIEATALSEFYAIRMASGLIGSVGLEVMENVALLRSLAVAVDHRGQGIAEELVRFAEFKAVSCGALHVYLLTDSAQGYFEKLGYAVISRDSAPEEIRSTAQFSHICPASAVFMVKDLKGLKGI